MQGIKKRIHAQHGFTLVEMMVVVVIFFFIIAAVLDAYLTQYRVSVAQGQVSDMQQNARIAMDFLSKEIRMAGFGMPSGAVNGFSNAITPQINNDATGGNNVLNGTDQLTLVTGYRQISTLQSAASPSATTITLAANGSQFNTGAKRYLCIDGAGSMDNYQVTGISGNQLTISPALTRGYQQDAAVLLVKAITYSVNDNRVLTRNENTGGGAQTIAPGIDDLQFAYQLADPPAGPGGWTQNIPADPGLIRAVRINVLARTFREDLKWRDAHLGRRPAVENRAAADQTDGFRRRLLTSVVEVRNLGF